LPDPTTPAGRQDYLRQLQMLWEDPRIRRLARSRAGDPEVAADALQEAYCAVARYGDPEKIEDLSKYFCRVLIHEIYRLLGQPRATLVDNFEDVADACQDNARGQPVPQPFDETVCTHLDAQTWLKRFADQREALIWAVPGRSPDPSHYRALIVAVAERVLLAMVTGDVSDADSNPALRAEYPAWFAEDGCETANCHQRFRRAREDVRRVLLTIVSRDDLYP
jgi:hypothetical protein